MTIPPVQHINALNLEMDWLAQLIDLRMKLYFNAEGEFPEFESVTPPLIPEESHYHQLLLEYGCTWLDRMILGLAIAPCIRPQVLDPFFTKNNALDRGYTEFGGIKGGHHGGFLPTLETACFLYGGDDLEKKMHVMNSLSVKGTLRRAGIIKVDHGPGTEPQSAGQIYVDVYWVDYLISGKGYAPEMSHNFPAREITTELEWEDLILDEDVLERIREIMLWMNHQSTLMHDWGLAKKLKNGYRCLFYGPAGTGKTLCATLLGKELDMPVFRVDLSLVVSKYIGETEKNLSKVFDLAENKKWILFFDEADALFGKRVQNITSNDRHANQEIAFLLQRIENFDGLAILATNFKSNLDEAFARRFQTMIYFPVPDKKERLLLWQSYFDGQLPLEEGIDFHKIAANYEITGGSIVNVLRYSSIMAVDRENQNVVEADILEGIRREMKQMGKSI